MNYCRDILLYVRFGSISMFANHEKANSATARSKSGNLQIKNSSTTEACCHFAPPKGGLGIGDAVTSRRHKPNPKGIFVQCLYSDKSRISSLKPSATRDKPFQTIHHCSLSLRSGERVGERGCFCEAGRRAVTSRRQTKSKGNLIQMALYRHLALF
jgi:hypothetical protein